MKRLHDELPVFSFAGKDVCGNLPLPAFGLENSQHLDELAEDEHLLAFRQQRLQQFEQRFRFSRRAVVANQLRMAADLAQASERGQHMNFALV